MARKIEKILEKTYIEKIFKKKKNLYFPSLKNKEITRVEIERVSQVWAKQTCLARYKIFFSNSTQKFVRATAKIDGSKREVYRIMNYLYQNGFGKGKFQIPRPLDYIEEIGALFYEETEGILLSLIFEKNKISIKIFEDITGLISKLHSFNGTKVKRKAVVLNLSHYKRIFREIRKLMPQVSDYITREEEIRFIEKLNKEKTFIHGDFYPGNILINKNRIILIDSDRAGVGPRLLDIATLYVSLEFPQSVWPLKLSQKQRKLAQEVFLKEYCRLNNFNLQSTKEKLNKFIVKAFLDQIYFLADFISDGWREVDLKTKAEFAIKIKDLFLKVREYLLLC